MQETKKYHQTTVLLIADRNTNFPFVNNNKDWITLVEYKSLSHYKTSAELQAALPTCKLIMAASGFQQWNKIIQQYMLEQIVNRKIPAIFFPYANIGGFEWPVLSDVHPLKHGSQTGCNLNDASTSFLTLRPEHPIMHGIVTFGCPASHRSQADAKPDAQVIATWLDKVPLVCERNNVVCLNFCLFNYAKDKDCDKMILQTIHYLLRKYDNMLAKRLIANKAYFDVQFVL